MLGNKIELDTANPSKAREVARHKGLTELNFTRAMVARWAWQIAPKDHIYEMIVNSQDVPYKACLGIGRNIIAVTVARRT